MTIIEKIRAHNAERYELAEALAQTFEDIDTYEHLLPALQADSQTLAQLKHQYWYSPLNELLLSDSRVDRALGLEADIDDHLQVLAQRQTGTRHWLIHCQQLLNTLTELQRCDNVLSHLAEQRQDPTQLEALGMQFNHAHRQAFTTARVA